MENETFIIKALVFLIKKKLKKDLVWGFFFRKDGFNGGRTSKEPIANNTSNNKNKNCSAVTSTCIIIMFLFILIALNN